MSNLLYPSESNKLLGLAIQLHKEENAQNKDELQEYELDEVLKEGLFERASEVREETEKAIEKEMDMAISALDAINVSEDKKLPLRELVNTMQGRQS